MDLLKKFFCIIILFSLLAVLFPLSSRAASTDIDIDFTKNAQTIFDIEDYLKRQQDTYLHFIKTHNTQVIDAIVNRFNNGEFFYISYEADSSKNDHMYFEIRFYTISHFFPTDTNYNYDTNNLFHTNINDTLVYDQNINQIGTYYETRVDRPNRISISYEYSENDNINAFDNVTLNGIYIPTCLVGYTSDYFIKFILGDGNNGGSSSNDYSNILYTISSDLSSLLYNSNTIMNDIANVKNYTNYINNKLTTTNTYLSNIQGAINNGSSTISNTIVSTHNLDNSNDNKNTNEIIDAINENTNAISDIQVTNDNSDLINAINNGFSNLNSNNNTNKNQIVSAINSASEEIVDGGNNNTNTIVSNSNSNTNDIVEAIEGVSITGGSSGITNSEFSQGVASINDNNNSNTNRILSSTVTEEDADIFENIDVPSIEDNLPDLSTKLTEFGNQLTSFNSATSKTFNFNIKGKNYTITLDYNLLRDKLFKYNQPQPPVLNYTLYVLWQALWWFLIGMFVFRKCKRIYNELIAGEWDEILTKTDIHDDIIDRSVK